MEPRRTRGIIEPYGRVRRRMRSVTELLTARELQIAVLIAQGFDKKAIGRRLGVSASTVAAHLARTYSKLGVRSRTALAARIAGRVALHRRSAKPARTADEALSS